MKQNNPLTASPMRIWLNKLGTYFSKPYNVILLVLGIVVTITTVAPIVAIVKDTLSIHPGTIDAHLTGKTSGYTLVNYIDLFTSRMAKKNLWTPLLNTVYLAVGTCVVSILFGGIFAFLITRTNLAWRKYLSSIFIFPYIMPQWTLAVVWQNLFNSNAVTRTANGLLASLFGITMPKWWCQGLFPSLMVLGLHYAPFAYILIGGIFRNMDANLEEAAIILRTNKVRMFTKITIPMVMPAVMSTIILVFSSGMSSFAVPQFLGLPVRYYVLTTEMYSTIQGTNPGVGYIIAILMMVISVAIMLANQYMIGTRKSYATVTGKSANISLFHLKKARTVVSLLVTLVVLCMSVIPMISFVLQSVILTDGNYHLSNMTLDFWIGISKGGNDYQDKAGILRNADVWKTLFNSLKLSFTCALGAGTVGFLAGYSIVRRRGSTLSRFVENLTFIPYLIPSMAFSAIYLSMFSQQRGFIPSLYGTFALLALIGTVKYLPMASRSGVNSMLQLSPEIEEAGVIMGIPWWKRMTRIIVPIQKSTIVSGYLLPFVSCMRELSLFVILVTANNRVLTTLLFFYDEKGWAQYGNAINLLIIFIVLLVNFVVEKLTGASIEKGVGGN